MPVNSNGCYQQLVLFSMPGTIIIDLLSSDPTFQKCFKFQAFKEANKMLLKSKEFARDVGMFSILQGSEYSGLFEVLGVDKVQLLWKGMAPNHASRPSLSVLLHVRFLHRVHGRGVNLTASWLVRGKC